MSTKTVAVGDWVAIVSHGHIEECVVIVPCVQKRAESWVWGLSSPFRSRGGASQVRQWRRAPLYIYERVIPANDYPPASLGCSFDQSMC